MCRNPRCCLSSPAQIAALLLRSRRQSRQLSNQCAGSCSAADKLLQNRRRSGRSTHLHWLCVVLLWSSFSKPSLVLPGHRGAVCCGPSPSILTFFLPVTTTMSYISDTQGWLLRPIHAPGPIRNCNRFLEHRSFEGAGFAERHCVLMKGKVAELRVRGFRSR